MPSSHNYFRMWVFFSPIRSNSRVFSDWFSIAHHLRIIHSSFQLSLSKSYRCIALVFSNQLVISSFSCIKSSQVSSIFPVNCAFAMVFFNSFDGSFKISLSSLSYQFFHSFVVSTPPVIPSRPSQVYAISLLILSTRISSMPNPLFVINLNWWRIRIP